MLVTSKKIPGDFASLPIFLGNTCVAGVFHFSQGAFGMALKFQSNFTHFSRIGVLE